LACNDLDLDLLQIVQIAPRERSSECLHNKLGGKRSLSLTHITT
jgi:hypothetical protein